MIRRAVVTLVSLAALALLGGNARAIASDYGSIKGSDGVVRVAFGYGFPTIRCSPKFQCDIVFNVDEYLTTNPVAGNLDHWDIRATHGYGGHVYVQPDEVAAATNVTVLTSKRTYHFFIDRDMTSRNIAFGWYYPHEYAEKLRQLRALAALPPPPPPAPEPTPMPTESPVCHPGPGDRIDTDYKPARGDASLRPMRVFNNGTQTCIRVGRLSEYPAIISFDASNAERQINYTTQVEDDGGRTYVVPALYSRFALILGSGKSRQEVYIEHK